MYVIGTLHHVFTMETLKVTTYNMHGFQSGLSCLTDLCDSGICDIICVQEHWLAPYNLNKLQNFHAEFDCLCWSAMILVFTSSVRTQRCENGELNTNDLLDLFDNLPVEFVPRSRLRNPPQERSIFTHSCHELSVLLDGQSIKYEHQPTFLGVTLDRTLSFRSHLTKTAAKLKNRNNLLTKLAGSRWGTDADTLWTSALALCYSASEYCAACYSAGEYCAPVWCRSAHTGLVDAQLNCMMRLISGTLRPTPLLWLLVLANIEPPPAVRGKAATDRLVAKASAHESWPLHHDISNPPQLCLPSRKPLWRELEPIDINSQWRESWKSASVLNAHLVDDPTIRQPGFALPRQQWSLMNRFCTGQGHCGACKKKWKLTDSDQCSCGETQRCHTRSNPAH